MEESILGANGLGSLETSARDAVRTIMEQTGIETLDDVQDALRQGALKVSPNGARTFGRCCMVTDNVFARSTRPRTGYNVSLDLDL